MSTNEEMTEDSGGDDKVNRARLSASATLRKLAFDRFVLTHFFLIFFVSFIIGVIFLHSTITVWQWQMNEDALMNILVTTTHEFTSSGRTKDVLEFMSTNKTATYFGR